MEYEITHTTSFIYSEPSPACHNQVCLTPRDTANQTCQHRQLIVSPEPAAIEQRADYFGNRLDFFSIHEPHRRLAVGAVSHVRVEAPDLPAPESTPAWETVRDTISHELSPDGLAAYQFVFGSPRVAADGPWRAYAVKSFSPGRPIAAAALELTGRIFKEFAYDPKATTVSTPIEEVFRRRRGVCQDFAHFQIACLRSLGLPARYVSGYLRTIPRPGEKKLVGADASHAWLSVFCGSAGWIDFDPTNNVIPTTDHITLAWGRDYSDVGPVRGVFIGGGQQTMTVAVDVEEKS